MAKISLCIIAKNEQNTIARCLESTKNFVAEMIVVDTGSTDSTVALAQNIGAKVFHYSWNNDFAAARNFALDQAVGDWIVFLDADEYFPSDLAFNLPALVKKMNGNRKIDAACLLMHHTESLGGPTIAKTYLVRLFRHSRLIRYQGRIHESINKLGRSPVAIYIPESELVIYHTGYSESNLPDKARRNLPLLEQDVQDNTINCLTYYHISQSHILLRNYEQAAHYALKALDNNDGILASNAQYKPYVYYIKSMLFLNLYDQDTFITMLKAAMEKYPDHPEILHCIAMYYLKCGHYSHALDFLLKALIANTNYCSTLDNEFIKIAGQVHEEIAVLHDKMNHIEQSFDHIIAAIKIDKYRGSSLAILLSQVSQQKPTNIIQLLDCLYDVKIKADIDFLVRNLAVLNHKLLFAHYLKLLSTKFQGNYFIGMKFLILDKFDAAFQCFATLFEHSGPEGSELFAIIAIMLAERPDWLIQFNSPLDSPLRKIAEAYFQQNISTDFSDVDYSAYSMLLLNFIRLSSEEQLLRLLRCSPLFLRPETTLTAIDHVLKQHIYLPVLRFCLGHLQSSNICSTMQGQLTLRVAFCYYKTKDWNLATDYCAQSLKYKSSRDAATEVLTWVCHQCNDPVVRQNIETLQAKYSLHFYPTI